MTKKNSHTSALFHYTRNQNVLIKILKEGLKFSYCKEKFSDDLCLGIPMISFCDIPIGSSFEHSSKYGQYAIAISKQKLIQKYKSALGPVNYFTSLSNVEAAFKLREEGNNKKQELEEIQNTSTGQDVTIKIEGKTFKGKTIPPKDASNALLLFLKSIEYQHSSTHAISLMKAYKSMYDGKEQVNYNECEWRIVLPENAKLGNGRICKWFWTESEYDNWRNGREDKFIQEFPLIFSVDDIDYIIVPTKELIPNFIKRLIKMKVICGNDLNERDRFSLVSKVISLEQIKSDF